MTRRNRARPRWSAPDRAAGPRRGRRARTLRERSTEGEAVPVILARGIQPAHGGGDPRRGPRRPASTASRSSRSRSGSTRSRRRSGQHARGAPHRVRQPRRPGPVRRRAVLPGRPRRASAEVIEADRDASGKPLAGTERRSRPGMPGEDIRLTIDAGLQLRRRAGGHGDADRQRCEERLGRRASTRGPARSTPRRRTRRTTRTSTRAIAAEDPSRFIDPVVSGVYEPGSVFKMMTAHGGARGKGTARTPDQGHRHAPPRQRPGADRRRRPPRRWAG